jgi:carboxyl-terminal processing protease
MRSVPRLLLLALVPLLLAAPGPGRAQEDGADSAEIRAQVEQLVADMAAAPLSGIWAYSRRLGGLGDRAVGPIGEALEAASDRTRLGLAHALLLLDETGAGLTTVRALARDGEGDVPIRSAAYQLLGSWGEDEDEELLLEALDANVDQPVLRVAQAKALWELAQLKRAKTELRTMLRSTDPDLRALGALALAEMGDVFTTRRVLEEFQDEPSERGRLCRALLEKFRWQTISIRQQEAAREEAEKAGGRSTFRVPALDMLPEIRMLLKWGHVRKEDLDDVELLQGAARGLLRTKGIDTHTQFFTAKERSSWDESLNPTYGGIGAYVNFDEDDFFTIVRPIFGGPAYRKELKPGDKVLRVDGWDTAGQPQEEIVKRLRGIPGTEVKILVYREGWAKPREISLKRAQITIPSAQSEILPGRVGYIRLTTFGRDTARELENECRRLERDQSIRGLILDLRWNSGGWLETARQVADVFLPRDKLIVYWEGPNPHLAFREEFHATQGTTRPSYPLVILVNQGSASASEIVAGSLQHHGRASLVGMRTYGKGTVQRVFPITSAPPSEPFTDTRRYDGIYNPPEPFVDTNENGRWDEDEDLLDLNRNGVWDDGEPFEDLNGDGLRQPNERFRDTARENGIHDRDEPFQDRDANGRWDAGERFGDLNRNRRYDRGEPFVDVNGNGKHDFAAVKITIGKYFLPDGRSLLRERRTVDGEERWVGGIEPDVRIRPETVDGWKVEEFRRLEELQAFDDYLKRLFTKHRSAFERLAYDDGRDFTRYPEFETFYASLQTKLEREDVRWRLRQKVRWKISDERGRELVGDFLDDLQLRRAIKKIFERLGDDLTKVEPYRLWADEEFSDLGPEDEDEETAAGR